MADKIESIADIAKDNQARSLESLDRLISATKPDAVFSEPIKSGDTLVITASEISVGLGFGFGMGSGPRVISNLPDQDDSTNEEETGMGSGGGGGGGAGARPVALITINGDEVEVKPILDFTKIFLAFFTMLGSVFFMGAQIRKRKR